MISGAWGKGSETGSKTGGETGSNTGHKTGSETGGETGSKTGHKTGSETGGKTGSKTGGETGGKTGSETGSEIGARQGVRQRARATWWNFHYLIFTELTTRGRIFTSSTCETLIRIIRISREILGARINQWSPLIRMPTGMHLTSLQRHNLRDSHQFTGEFTKEKN